MKLTRTFIAALALLASTLFITTPTADAQVLIRNYRAVATCTSGNPVNQVTRYGPWVNREAPSVASCTLSYPYILYSRVQVDQPAGTYYCSTFKNTAVHPDRATGTCRWY